MRTSAIDSAVEAEVHQDKRDRIMERAIIMFNELGYERVRVSDITDSLNMGKGTFYVYFRNKKDLLIRCFDYVNEKFQLFEAIAGIPEGDFFTRMACRTKNVHDHPWWSGLVTLLRVSELHLDEEVRTKAIEAYRNMTSNVRRDLEAAIETERARAVDPELAAYGFIGMAENLWFRERLDDRYSTEDVIAFFVDAVTRWLSSETFVEERPRPRATAAVCLVDRAGTQFHLKNIRCNGEDQLTAALGLARIELDPTTVSSLVVVDAGDECVADLEMSDGTGVRVRIDGSMRISGTAPIGTIDIAMHDVSSLTRDGQPGHEVG